MINQDKWINSLPKTNTEFNNTTIQLDHDRWTDTLAKKNTYNTVKKYSFMAFLFVFIDINVRYVHLDYNENY